MAYRIKHGINTAVSLALVVAEHTDEETGEKTVVEQEQIFLPGAVLPSNFSPRQAQLVDDGDEHLCSLIEKFDGNSAPTSEAQDPVFVPPAPQPQPEPVAAPAEVEEPVADEDETPTAESVTPQSGSDDDIGKPVVNPFAPTDPDN